MARHPAERITSAADNIWFAALSHRNVTSLANQVGATTLLHLPLEAALLSEIEAAGIHGIEARDAMGSILYCMAGFLIGAWRTEDKLPERLRRAALWRSLESSRFEDDTIAAMQDLGDPRRLFEMSLKHWWPRFSSGRRSEPTSDRPTRTNPRGYPLSDEHKSAPGEVAGIPKLVIRYPSRAESIEALLPPGMKLWGDPVVQLGVYCVPVRGEPEFGVSTKIPASWSGTDGWFTLGIGIDQESAIFVSRETNGQPKFPCDVRYFRLGERIEASATHQGRTFLTYSGAVTGERRSGWGHRRRRMVDKGLAGSRWGRRGCNRSRPV